MVNNPGEYEPAAQIHGKLGIIALPGCEKMAQQIDGYITGWRQSHIARNEVTDESRHHYTQDSFLLSSRFDRFSTGEGKATIGQSVRGLDLYLLCDCFNYGVEHTMYGKAFPTSPDEHFANLKRAISAAAGKERRLTVIMPMLYEGRQHKRSRRESLDCAMALQELVQMGADNIITFDAHDPRVQNAIPNCGFENVPSTYQMIKAILNSYPDVNIDKESLMIISPDEGGMDRCIAYSTALGVDIGMFYKRRDYSTVVDGRNPIISHQFLGENVAGKDVVVVDDMISSGDSVIDVCIKLRDLGAARIFCCCSFGLFSSGLDRLDAAYAKGLFDKIFTCGLLYTPDTLKERPWFVSVRMSKYIAYLIDTLNHDMSISRLLTPNDRIERLLVSRGYRIG